MLRLFLDASVLLAASGSATGASHAVFSHSLTQSWLIQSSPYALAEAEKNLGKLSSGAVQRWKLLRPQLIEVKDIVTLNMAAVFPASQDRPILLSAFAWSDVLLTFDTSDFTHTIGEQFYGLRILMPHEFLRLERKAGRFII